VYVAGQYEGTADFGGGPLPSNGMEDVFVAKYDAAGNHLWSKHFGDADNQWAQALAVTPSGDVVIRGGFGGSVAFGGGPLTGAAAGASTFVARLDSSGNHVWSHAYIPSSLSGLSLTVVALDGAGSAVFGGGLFGSTNFGGGTLQSA